MTLLADIEGGEAVHEAHLYHAALVIVIVIIAAVAALFAVVPQLMCPSLVCLHELQGRGRRLAAGVHQSHDLHWIPSRQSDSAKTDQGHHQGVPVGRRVWCRMMMVLPTLVKGELGERRDVDDILGQDKLELCILHFEKLCLTMN